MIERDATSRIDRVQRSAVEQIVREREARRAAEGELSCALAEIVRLRQALDDAEIGSYAAPQPF